MRILIIHNVYLHRGGEESVVDAEATLLRRHGHKVMLYQRDNKEIDQMPATRVLTDTIWSRRSADELKTVVRDFKPDVAHAHNTFPLVSPSAYWALSEARVPVVQTLHNFRSLCIQATFLRNETVCEDCLGHLPWRGVLRRCYRGSAVASSVVATMIGVHRMIGSYKHKVSRYIALSEFARAKFIQGGLPAERIEVKPNFADVPSVPAGSLPLRRGGLFVGRLSTEKGIALLVEALGLRSTMEKITVIGTGPLESMIQSHPCITPVGWLQPSAVYERMRRAAYLILPSICYEGFPRTLVEAFACGLPVIASRMGPMAELIQDGRTGLLFDPGFSPDLAEKIAWAEEHPQAMREMGRQAQLEYQARYTPEINHARLMAIYTGAIEQKKPRSALSNVGRAHG